jgi:hypothetical protein
MALTQQQFEKLRNDLRAKKQAASKPSLATNIKSSFNKRVDTATNEIIGAPSTGQAFLRTVGQGAAFAGDIGAETIKSGLDLVGAKDVVKTGVSKVVNSKPIKTAVEGYSSWASKHPEAAKDFEAVVNIGSLIPVGKGAQIGASGLKRGTEEAFKFGVVGAEKLAPVTNKVAKLVGNTKGTIESFGERITMPDVPEAVKVSLNPKEALKKTTQDIQVSVGGKTKKLSEVTPTENMKLKISTEKSLNSFTKQAESFAKDRGVTGGSPVEIVGNRVDKALDFANKKRQVVGAKMGEIELKYVDDSLPISEKTLNTFTETLKSFDNPKFGADNANANIVRKMIQDFDVLEKSGATVGDRLNFVRSWDRYLNDSKDAFGNFKENASINTQIQNAVRVLKDETVDAISTKDKVYRNLRQQYRVYKQLDEIGDSLLGKDGALGQRVKGAATVKRAIQSNSDAGARQFLLKLRELTGYDAIKEGDIALTAMKNVGDYQGLSLLNILQDGKAGIIKKVLSKAQDIIVGDDATRIKKYIRK